MKTLIKSLSLVIIALLITQCEEYAEIDGLTQLESGQISIEMNKKSIPAEVVKIKGFLSRTGHETIDFSFKMDEEKAWAHVENIPAGVWKLLVNAYDSNGTIVYSGSVEATVVIGSTTTIDLHLSNTGSIAITVTWNDGGEGIYVNIPDSQFLAALIEEGVDANNDEKISYQEAEAVRKLTIQSKNIENLQGLEAFVNLHKLNCSFNFYRSIDVSQMKDLVYLDCSESELESLDVSNNFMLEHLDCSDQQIPVMDVTNNPSLVYLNCHNNPFSNLDLSNNPNLTLLWAQETHISSLDISGCKLLTEISLHSIPSLYKVCVWTTPFPPDGVHVDTHGSPNIYYSTNCN